MGKGLPKKYAKMGFKKGWREYKKSKGKTSKKRSSPKRKRKRSSRRYTRSSSKGNPGGASTPKIGAVFRGLKAAFNYTAAAQGAYTETGSIEGALRNAVARYTGAMVYDTGQVDFDPKTYAFPNWQGMAVETGIQYLDAKTRHYANVSRKKLLDIAEEAIPIAYAYGQGGDMATMADNYHQVTTGYSMRGAFGNFDIGRTKPYVLTKLLRVGLDYLGARKFINKRLPKGLNL